MTLRQFNDYLNSFDYGAVINGEKHTDLDNVDWSEYKTLSPEDFEDARMGICWDFVNYQHRVFELCGIENKSYFYVKRLSDDPADIVTHTFSMLYDDTAWFESSLQSHQGIFEVKSAQDVFDALEKAYPSDYPGELYEYDADKTIGLSDHEFFNEATDRRIV